MYQELIRNELTEAASVLQAFLADEQNLKNIEAAAKLLADSFKEEGKVLSCGNGGSHCDAMHFAEELTGRYRENRPNEMNSFLQCRRQIFMSLSFFAEKVIL
ncbi:MAG: SIS domain-containing protein, partial [Aeromonas veronii]